MGKVRLLTPIGAAPVTKKAIMPHLTELRGRVIGFLDNVKPNARIFLDRTADLLKRDYGIEAVVTAKANTSVPAQSELLDRLAEQCDAVVIGFAD